MRQLKTIIILLTLMLSIGIVNAKDIVIEVTQLPQKLQTFLKTHFSESKVSYVIKDKGLLELDYEVTLGNLTKIEFDENGDWTEVDGKDRPIPTGFISKSIVDYVKEKFPDAAITQIEKKSKKYEVEINGDLDLIFDLNGKFIGIDD